VQKSVSGNRPDFAAGYPRAQSFNEPDSDFFNLIQSHSEPGSDIYGVDLNMKINPLDDRVVVRPNEAEETTAGGIVLPDAAKEKQQRGTVLAVGPGRLLDSGERCAVSVKVGDQVLFGKYGGTEIEVDGEEVKILRESDILAKLV